METFALLIWPVVALLMFRKLPVLQGLIWVVLIPYMFLPEATRIALPGLPDIDKTMVVTIGLLLSLVVYSGRVETEFGYKRPPAVSKVLQVVLWLCAFALLGGLVLTVWNNFEPLKYGPIVIPAARPWDIISEISKWFLTLFPFFFAARYLSTPQAHRALLTAFVAAGLAYSVLMLIELRFSPQLHNWLYGYHQHSFLQHIRGGYRPMVFLQHGLWVGFFIFMTVMAAAGLWKATGDQKWLKRGAWLLLILLVSKNTGASGIALFMLALFVWFGQRIQKGVIFAIAATVMVFPMLRQADVFPTDQIIAVVEGVSEDRAQSLEFRFRNEDSLLERAWEKKWTGWGGWGRDLVYTENGRIETISEGLWTLSIGRRGWIGYLSLFGMLVLPLIWLSFTPRNKVIPPETIALALIAAGNLIYMIPNATMTPIGLLTFGAVAGSIIYGRAVQEDDPKEEPKERKRRSVRYSRFGPETQAGS